MSGLKEYLLGNVAEVQTGPFGSQLHMSDYKLVGTPIITVEHLGENKILHNNLPLVGNEDKDRLIKYTLKEGDIVFSRVGSVDRRAYVSKDEDGWMFSGRCLRVRANEKIVNPKFLSFYFGQEGFKETIRMVSVGATMPSINTTILNEIEIRIPSLPEQTAIAEVLSSLDDKIDLLHRQNKTLEQLAETLFRQWFVEEAEESWEEKSLKEIVSVVVDNRGKTPPTVEYKTDYPLIEVNTLNSGTCLINYDVIRKYVSKETYESWFRKHLKENDIIFSTVGTIGVFSIFLENIGAIAQNLIGIRFEKFSPYFIYCFFKMNVENILNLDIGGVQPSIKVPHLLEMKIKCPPQSLLDEFHKTVEWNFQKIKSNTQQIRTLTQLRDTLLPKLMSGEVRVNK